MDSYIELLYPCVSSQFQTSFPPQLNRQKFWFIISPDRIIINPTFTPFHSNFMGCHGCDSFGHKFSPYILLFFTILVSMWGVLKFCFLALLSGVHCHCRLINTSKVYLFVLLLCSFVEENLNASVGIRMCVCVCCVHLWTKMSRSPAELLTLAQMHCFSTTYTEKWYI